LWLLWTFLSIKLIFKIIIFSYCVRGRIFFLPFPNSNHNTMSTVSVQETGTESSTPVSTLTHSKHWIFGRCWTKSFKWVHVWSLGQFCEEEAGHLL
jgi:hypothetical protein